MIPASLVEQTQNKLTLMATKIYTMMQNALILSKYGITFSVYIAVPPVRRKPYKSWMQGFLKWNVKHNEVTYFLSSLFPLKYLHNNVQLIKLFKTLTHKLSCITLIYLIQTLVTMFSRGLGMEMTGMLVCIPSRGKNLWIGIT